MNIIWCTEKRYKTMLDPAFLQIFKRFQERMVSLQLCWLQKTPKPCLMNFFKKPVIMIIMTMKMKMNSSVVWLTKESAVALFPTRPIT